MTKAYQIKILGFDNLFGRVVDTLSIDLRILTEKKSKDIGG
jgi:hypothetical protein